MFRGEAGSGKSESTKHILSQLVNIHHKLSKDEKRYLKLKNRLLAAQHVLQLFAHCKTLSGPNSSRHTVLTEVHYDMAGYMQGVQFSSYAFERSRITSIDVHDRNFHVFYALLAGATSAEKSDLKLQEPSKFAYLCKGTSRSDFDNARLMSDLRSSFSILGMSSKIQAKIFEILAALLHLGNVEFCDAQQSQDSAQVKNLDVLNHVSFLLGLDSIALQNVLMYQTKVIHTVTCTVFLDAQRAAERRDKFVQAIYYLLFSWILKFINSKLLTNRQDRDPSDSPAVDSGVKSFAIINILDVAGYEVLPKNGFHQFLVNYLNEKLHSIQLKDITLNVKDYSKEGLETKNPINGEISNQCLKFFEDPSNGAFQVLEEYGQIQDSMKGKDLEFFEDLKRINEENKNPSFVPMPSNGQIFGLKQYFGVTQYHCDNFVASNLEELGPDFLALIFGGYGATPCTNSLMTKLFMAAQVKSKVIPGGVDIGEVYIAENSRTPSRMIPSNCTQLDRNSTLLSRRSAYDTSRTLCRKNFTKYAKTFHCNGDLSTNCVATELFCEIEELLGILLETSHISFILCLRVLKTCSNKKKNATTGSTKTMGGVDTLKSKLGTIRGAFNFTFDRDRLAIQLRAHCILETLNLLTSSHYPIKISYTLLINSANIHSRLTYDEPLVSASGNGNIKDTHEHRETMRDYLWLKAGLADLVTANEFYFGGNWIFMTAQAYEIISSIFRRCILISRPTKFLNECVLTSAEVVQVHPPPVPSEHLMFYSGSPDNQEDIYVEADLKDSRSIFDGSKSIDLASTIDNLSVNLRPQKPNPKLEEGPQSFQRKFWLSITFLFTWWAPGTILKQFGLLTKEMQTAWREKFSLCVLIFILSAFLLFYIMGLSYILCPPQKIINRGDLSRKPVDQPNIIVRGQVYDMTKFLPAHTVGTSSPENILRLAGKDCTALFPTKHRCILNIAVGRDSNFDANDEERVGRMYAKKTLKVESDPGLSYISEPSNIYEEEESALEETEYDDIETMETERTSRIVERWIPSDSLIFRDPGCVVDGLSYCHSDPYMFKTLEQYWVGAFGMTRDEVALANNNRNALIVINERIYNVTTLWTYNGTLTARGQEAFIEPPWGVDKTAMYSRSNGALEDDLYCLEDYFVGVIDNRHSLQCVVADFILIGSTALVVAVMAFKFLAALQLGQSRDPETLDKFVILQVPCYTEGEESLRKTIEALASLKYQDSRKLMFIVADGMIVGSGNDRSTPKIVLDILGVDPEETPDPEPLSFISVGKGHMRLNRGKVYAGFYENAGHRVPFIVVVKIGNTSERSRPGNRGKRDSQMILFRFLSKVHSDLPMNPLELAIYHAIRDVILVDPSVYEYTLMVDADTCVFPDALNRMISCMLHDAKVMGLCGETRIANETETWVTMIQVYEYYISHHLAKAFESLFGSVTCLPGCFCMYRIKSFGKGTPLLIDSRVLDDYAESDIDTLHQRNLLSLGEDRYLTTLMLKYFPTLKASFTPDARCCTTVPDRWTILLSQRRRWINSTIHNLWELLLLPQLCGCACFSMRFVVILDLFATLVMPATVGYLFFLIYQAVYFQMVPVISLCMLGAVYGMQVIIFLLKRQWQYIGWMLIYILALPLYGLFIPLYSFWHFDDFSWGNTRRVTGEKRGRRQQQKRSALDDVDEFDGGQEEVPHIRWSEYLAMRASSQTSGAVVCSATASLRGLGASNSVIRPMSLQGKAQKISASNSSPSCNSNSPSSSANTLVMLGQYASARQPSPPAVHDMALVPISSIRGTAPPHSTALADGACLTPAAGIWPFPAVAVASSVMGPAQHDEKTTNRFSKLVAVSCHPRNPSVTSGTNLYFPTDTELITAIKEILATSDLSKITKKSIRDRLAEQFGSNIGLTSKKEFINNIIGLILSNQL